MNTTLTVDDPLAGQEVTIVVTLSAGDQPREERLALVSLGIPEHMPITKTGALADLPALIHQAWIAFGVRAQVADTTQTEPEAETVAEELVATAASDEEALALPDKPPAGNLSLF
jgi:hypothetical protein